MNNLMNVSFQSKEVPIIEHNGVLYVAIKPICKNIGLQWEAQQKRISRDEVLNSTMSIMDMVAEDGKVRKMVCLPIQYLNGWLFGVNVQRVKPEIKDTLIMYKKECYQALHDYWHQKKGSIQNQLNDLYRQEAISKAKGSFHGKGLRQRRIEKTTNRNKIRILEQKAQPSLLETA